MELQTQLYQHQKDGVAKSLSKPNAFAYLAETGTGKSVMVLAEFQERLGKDITDLLVIAPMGCIRNWYLTKGDKLSELERHLDPELFKRLFIVTNRRKAADRKQQEAMMKTNRPKAMFVNIEALSRGNKDELLCRKLLVGGKVMMVIDESTTIRAHKSQRSKAITRLGALAACKRILTGLVTPKSPLDLYNQFNFLDRRILNAPSYVGFRARYAKLKIICREPEAIVDMRLRQIMIRKRIKMRTDDMTYQAKVEKIIELGGWIKHVPIIEDYQNLDELQRKIAPYSFQILKKDCLDLEPKTYQFRDVDLTPEQKRIYKEVLEDATSQLGDGTYVTASTVLAQMMRLHQIVCGHVKNEDGVITDIGTNRISSLIEVLNEHSGKAIIWVCYDYEVRRIAEAIGKEFGHESVARFWGGNAKTRNEDESRFLSKPECRFMVSTQMSGGRGNTWNVATLAVYAANNHDLEHRYQSEDRCHRIGQTNKVTYIDLIARDTVEEKIVWALRKKIDLATAITGENFRQWLV